MTLSIQDMERRYFFGQDWARSYIFWARLGKIIYFLGKTGQDQIFFGQDWARSYIFWARLGKIKYFLGKTGQDRIFLNFQFQYYTRVYMFKYMFKRYEQVFFFPKSSFTS